jgi:hypothetical protein
MRHQSHKNGINNVINHYLHHPLVNTVYILPQICAPSIPNNMTGLLAMARRDPLSQGWMLPWILGL